MGIDQFYRAYANLPIALRDGELDGISFHQAYEKLHKLDERMRPLLIWADKAFNYAKQI